MQQQCSRLTGVDGIKHANFIMPGKTSRASINYLFGYFSTSCGAKWLEMEISFQNL